MGLFIGKTIPANLFRGMESVGGTIIFKEDTLVFNSHAFNIQTGTTRLAYAKIASINKKNTLGLIPNGISVIMMNGEKYDFVVFGRKKIIEFLNQQITQATSLQR